MSRSIMINLVGPWQMGKNTLAVSAIAKDAKKG